MPPRTRPPLFAAVLRHLRHDLRGWSQQQLEQAARLPRGAVSKIERGEIQLDRARLERLASALELAPEALDRALSAFEQLPQEHPAADLVGLSAEEAREIERVARDVGRSVTAFVRGQLVGDLLARHVASDRDEAGVLWGRLRRRDKDLQEDFVRVRVSYQTWAVCERLCGESVSAAADDAERALHLAKLALLSAERSVGREEHRSRREGYAWAFLGNARRVAGDLPAAETAFRNANERWNAGEASPAEPFDGSRFFDLRSSLRRQQGREEDALADLATALRKTTTPERMTSIALNRAVTLTKMERHEEALAQLTQVEPLAAAPEAQSLRLRWLIECNLVSNLCYLGRFCEAEERFSRRVQPLTLELGNGLDLVRVRWLEARVDEGMGRREEAAERLREVWQAYADRKITFDAALAVLELAALELDRGRTKQVKVLAGAAAEVFAAQAIPRELLASCRLFWQAAKKEMATAAAARHLLTELRRARPTAA